MNQCPPSPQVFHRGRFEFFPNFSEIFPNEFLPPVSTTPAINPCHGISVIAGVVDTGNTFLAGDNGKNFSSVSLTPAIAFFFSVVDTGQK
jgi:hypothetical protein